VVVCGAGPSLDSALPVIKSERGRVCLMAVDTALPTLAAAGITPDLVVAIEGQVVNIYDFLPVAAREYTLLADISSAPSVVGIHEGSPVSWLCSRFADIELLDRVEAAGFALTALPPLGSVGVAAVALAGRITSGPVLLTGLDFAVPPGVGHARSSAPHLRRLLAQSRTAPGPADLAVRWISRDGASGPVRTTMAMVGYAEELQNVVRELSNTVVVVDPLGLPTGARAICASALGEFLDAAGDSAQPAGERDGEQALRSGPASADLIAFVERELAFLARLTSSAQEAMEGGDAPTLNEDHARCDYVTMDFPDVAGPLGRERALLARVVVAADYYRERWERTLTSLRS
jgi:hypothetical protein